MAVIKKIETEIGILGIWKLSESVEDLLSIFQFSNQEKEEFGKIKADRRKIEYLAIRLLLQNIFNNKQEVQYIQSGKPVLKNVEKNISISHSSELVSILISEKIIGIDVENTERKIEKIAHRFLHKKELGFIQKLDNPQIAKILYWSAKEAIFKCTNSEGVQFNEQILIPPFEIKKEGHFTGILNETVQYKLWYFFYKNNVIVYCVELLNRLQ